MSQTYSELKGRVRRFLGLSGTANSDVVEDVIQSGYRRFLTFHDWSFLRKVGSITTVASQYRYALPSDFVSVVDKVLNYDVDSQEIDVAEALEAKVMAYRNQRDWESAPLLYAIRHSDYNASSGSFIELIMYPTPDSAYTLNYRYVFDPEDMSSDADIPIGGPRMFEVIRQCCLAAAESEVDHQAGVQNQLAMEALVVARSMDLKRGPSNLGSYGGGLVKFPNPRITSEVTYTNE